MESALSGPLPDRHRPNHPPPGQHRPDEDVTLTALSYGFKWSGLQVGTPPLCELTISEPDIEVRQMVTSPGVPSPVPEVQGQGDQLAAFPLVTGGRGRANRP